MNKIYQRIDWENYPSSATPLNEDNLNKMDYTIDKLDDRIVTHETTKLNTATGNTLVKNVTFNETTGVFTIEKLSGSKITINTALEKISTNFHFNPTTQKLVLTLIDGTVQEIDLSALLTQYEFLESDTITFEIDASGKVKANILNGSITGEKLEPNYLANVTLQAKNAKTSADNAKTSEELAYQYAEEAKESASQTAKSDAKNITYDNTESGLSATNVKDALDEVAQGSVSAIATDTTITDSTNAPLIYGKFKGYTLQDGEPTPDNPIEINGLAKDGAIEVKTYGKNLINPVPDSFTNNGVTFTKQEDGSYKISGAFEDAETSSYVDIFSNKSLPIGEYILSGGVDDNVYIRLVIMTDGESNRNYYACGEDVEFSITNQTSTISVILVFNKEATVASQIFKPMIRPAEIADDTYKPYTETTAAIPTDAPLYEGDYLEVYADGSGKIVRKMAKVVFDGDEQFSISGMLSNDNRLAVYYNPIDAKISIGGVNSISNQLKRISCTEAQNDETKTGFFVGDTMYNANHSFIVLVFPSTTATDLSTLQTWLQSNPVTVVYELAESTETPLTAEQVAQFKKLCTFEPVTNVFCEGETEIQYYKNTDSGETVAMVSKKANNSVSKSSIANNLTTTTEGMVLDATQGKALDDKISTLNNRLSKSLVSTETINIDSLSLSSGGLSTITSEEISKSGYTLVGAKFFLRGSYAENIIASFTIGGSNTKIYNFVFYNPSDYDISAYGYVDLIYVANSL